jgi:hypothetical protein
VHARPEPDSLLLVFSFFPFSPDPSTRRYRHHNIANAPSATHALMSRTTLPTVLDLYTFCQCFPPSSRPFLFSFSLATNLPVYKLDVYYPPRDRKIKLSTHYQNRRASVRIFVLSCAAPACAFLPFSSHAKVNDRRTLLHAARHL